MKQIAQNYKSGELSVLDVPAPVCRPGGVLVQSLFSLISTGTEMMKLTEAKMSMVGKARARPDQVRKVIDSVAQQGAVATYKKVMNRLDSYTPLGYSLCGLVIEVGRGAEEFHVGQLVAAAGNEHALHAEYNWIPVNLCAGVPKGVSPEHAAFSTVGAIATQATIVPREPLRTPAGRSWRRSRLITAFAISRVSLLARHIARCRSSA